MRPKISIIIVTYNDKENLVGCLFSLKKQTYPAEKREIIVVDDGSTDGTAQTLHLTFPEIKVIRKKNSGADNSRIYGVREAKGEIVAFIDSDCTALPEWLENITRGLKENHTSIIGGQILHRGSFWARLIGVSDFGEFQGLAKKEVNNIPTCNMGVRREVFERFSFNPHLRIGGDTIFCNALKKNGYRLLYDSRVKVIHRPQTNFLAFFRRAYRYGKGFIYIRRIKPTLPYAKFIKFGLPGVMCVTLGRIFLDWYRLFRHRRVMGIKICEILPTIFFLFFKRFFSLLGALNGYWSRKR